MSPDLETLHAEFSQVRIIGYVFSKQGLGVRVSFSTMRSGKKILWDQSKRLKCSTLVALTPAASAFQKRCIVATVAARSQKGMASIPPHVDLFMADPLDLEVDPQVEWLMVEARDGYFESCRHTLTGLQRMVDEK